MNNVKYNPRFPGPIHGRAVNLVRQFYPKLCAEYEFEDLMQEAYIVFMRCKEKYGAVVDNPAWFMSLFSRSLQNKLINLATRCGRYISIEELESGWEPSGSPDEALMHCTMKELPSRVRGLIGIFLNGTDNEQRDAYRRLRKIYPEIV